MRAYSGAVQEGIANSTVIEKIPGVLLEIGTDYNGLGRIQYILGQRGLRILNSEYTESVKIQVLVPDEEFISVRNEITDKTNGQAKMTVVKECMYARVDDEELIFD